MSKTPDAVASARKSNMAKALERWNQQAGTRTASLSRIRELGPGAGDSPQQLAKWVARENARALLTRAGLERRIGTWDPTFYAPSEAARQAARPVARLVNAPRPGTVVEGFATGFLVSPSLLLTNQHVFPRYVDAVDCAANFLYERQERGINEGTYFNLQPDQFYFADEALDFCLVAISAQGTRGEALSDYGCIRLIEATGKTLRGRPMNIIQHPDGGPRQYATTHNRLLDILDQGFLHYETDTAEGASGSPVFSDNWELIALHHCGIPRTDAAGNILKTDHSLWNPEGDEESTVDWVANEGTRVSSIIGALKALQLSGRPAELLAQLMEQTADPLAALSVNEAVTVTPQRPGMADRSQNIFHISGPTTINILSHAADSPASIISSLGVAPAEPVSTDPAPAVAALEKTLTFDLDYEARPGYDPDFLGVPVPPPFVEGDQLAQLYRVGDYREHAASARNVPAMRLSHLDDDAPLELPYHRYSLVMNKKYRMPMWAASNADYRPEVRGDARGRRGFGGESWRLDRRVPSRFQLTNSDIYAPAGNFDRGHIVRREDSCWGQPGIDTEYANADTYHWTNCTPQHELFNQESPDGAQYRNRKGIWGYFEGELAEQIEAGGGQAVIFAGPVLGDSCVEQDFGKGPVHYPTRFWKIVIVPKDESRTPELLAYGFLFDQSEVIKEFGLDVQEAALDLAKAFQKQQATLADICQMAGISLAPSIMAADQHKPG
ncbi:endonuclease G, mitochondrial [Pseudomonas chlororaphis]|uniref:DNA/RNA non-specific endonuclease n=1 Tax=Pseudomonas chlororaphis TaxID=587753 RepID=UPI0039E2E12E